jgi:hypothetical protein
MLLSVVEAHVQKHKGGMLWVLCGRDEFNIEVDPGNLAAAMVELSKGKKIMIPNESGRFQT